MRQFSAAFLILSSSIKISEKNLERLLQAVTLFSMTGLFLGNGEFYVIRLKRKKNKNQ